MLILGLDPGTVNYGFALLYSENNPKLTKYGNITVSKTKTLSERLHVIHEKLEQLIIDNHPNEIAIEKPFLGNKEKQFFHSSLAIGQAQAIAFIIAGKYNIPVFQYAPTLVKYSITNYGNAKKEQVQIMIKNIFNIEEAIQEDTADAIGVAVCHSYNQKSAKIYHERKIN